MAKPAIVLVKSFSYRGSAEEWSNRYFFTQSPPTTDAAWKTLTDLLIAKEKTVYPAPVTVVRAYGYADSNNDATWMYDYAAHAETVAGTFSPSSGTANPGDVAAWVRWTTTKKNSKGKTVYLRKYYHQVYSAVGTADTLQAQQVTAMQALGTALMGGTGAISGFTLCGQDGTAAGAAAVSTYVTTRTLKRRGKRPPT